VKGSRIPMTVAIDAFGEEASIRTADVSEEA
jgi:hypothetical protein